MPNDPLELPSPLVPPQGFVERVRDLGVEFEEGDVEKLGAFLALMLAANERFNLTAIKDPAEAWTRHILDAMTLVPLIAAVAEEGGGRGADIEGVDIGSGGGVPALPLAIVMPEAGFTLVEATGKKAEFLREAARLLELNNVTVVNDRAERLGQIIEKKQANTDVWYRDRFDFAIARAVGHLAIVAELCVPMVRPPEEEEGGGEGGSGGVVFAVKGAKAPQELDEAKKAMGILRAEHATTVDTPTGKVVVLEKVGPTPRTYPRKDGEPKRVPLGLPKNDKQERGE